MVGNDSNGWTRRADQCIRITWQKYSTSKYGQKSGNALNQPIETQEQKTAREETFNVVSLSKGSPDNSAQMLDHTNAHAVPKMLTSDKELCPPINMLENGMYELQDRDLQIYASKNIDPASRKLLLCSKYS